MPQQIGNMGVVSVYSIRSHRRSRTVSEKACQGLAEAGFEPHPFFEDEYRVPVSDIAVFYGYKNNLPRIMREHKTAVSVDLGYWQRREADYHKIAINDRHPTAYFRGVNDPSRLKSLGIRLRDWRKSGDFVLVAGMSHKAAEACGYGPGEWESWAIEEVKKHTDLPVLYRPKPSCKFSRIVQADYAPSGLNIQEALKGCHALVTHHSNCAVDALVEGIPVFVWEGVASPMGLQDLSKIEDPYFPSDRQAWAEDIAWTQWTFDEIATSAPWEHLHSRGLI